MIDAWAAADRKKSKHETMPAELYPTPPEATAALLAKEQFPHHVWEPAAGLGHISRVLEAAGHQVTSTDLHADRYGYGTCLDFLEKDPIAYPSGRRVELVEATAVRAIITNSPYSLLRAFMVRALTMPNIDKVALFTPFEALRVKANVEVWKEHGFPRVHLLMPTLTIDCGPERGMVKSIFNHCWMVWDHQSIRHHVDLHHLFWKKEAKLVNDLL